MFALSSFFFNSEDIISLPFKITVILVLLKFVESKLKKKMILTYD